MGEPGQVHPSMTKADGWPLSAAETILASSLTYLVLLISLAVARIPVPASSARTAVVATLLGAPRPVAVVQRHALTTCVTARTVPESYAAAPGVRPRLAFGSPVEASGPNAVAEVNGELWHRLCGGVGAGGRPHRPDRRLYVAIDAAVNRRDPNRVVSQAEWAAGVVRFIVHDALWDRARLVTLTVPRGTVTFGMRVRPGADPLVVRTRLAAATRSGYLVLPVRDAGGRVVTLTLRLPCGFQPTFVTAATRPAGS